MASLGVGGWGSFEFQTRFLCIISLYMWACFGEGGGAEGGLGTVYYRAVGGGLTSATVKAQNLHQP